MAVKFDVLLGKLRVKDSSGIGSSISGSSSGSVLFVDSSLKLAESNSNFFWDDTNNRLGIGTNSPSASFEISKTSPELRLVSTNDSNYTRLTRTDSLSVAKQLNIVGMQSSAGYALSFSGVNQGVSVPDDASLNITGNFSVGCWMKSVDLAAQSYAVFLSKRSSGDNNTINYYIGCPADGRNFRLIAKGVTVIVDSAGIDLMDTSWHFVVATRNSTTGSTKIYIDGVLKKTTAAVIGSVTNTGSLGLGIVPDINSNDFRGIIDEAFVFSRILTDGGVADGVLATGEIADLYNAGVGLVINPVNSFPSTGTSMSTSLAGIWHLDENTGTTISDSSSNANNGSFIGTPTWVTGLLPVSSPSDVETMVWSSQDGANTGEQGIQTFGDSNGRTVLDGQTLRFNIGGTEYAQMNSSGHLKLNGRFTIQDIGVTSTYLTVLTDGKIGIGTDKALENQDNPVAKFSIKGDTADSTTGAFIVRNNVDNVNSSSLFYVRCDGAVGVGSLSKGALAPASFTTNLHVIAGTTKRFGFYNVSTAVGITTSGNDMRLTGLSVALRSNYGTEVLRVASTKRIGIGITTPSSKLQVNGTADEVQTIIKGFSTQTNELLIVENSIGTDYFVVDGAGQTHTKQGILRNTTRVTNTYTILATDHHIFANTDSASYTITLPIGINSTEYRIINTGTSNKNLTITPNGAEKLLGQNSSFTLADGESLTIVYESTDGWY